MSKWVVVLGSLGLLVIGFVTGCYLCSNPPVEWHQFDSLKREADV